MKNLEDKGMRPSNCRRLILQPKQFHAIRFSIFQLRVYETVLASYMSNSKLTQFGGFFL